MANKPILLLIILLIPIINVGCDKKVQSLPTKSKSEFTTTTSVQLERFDPPNDADIIQLETLKKIMTKIVKIELDSPIIRLQIGDKLSFDSLKVYAYDKESKKLGRLPFVNTSVDFGAIAPDGDRKVKAVRPGQNSITLKLPMYLLYGGLGSIPETTVQIIVQ